MAYYSSPKQYKNRTGRIFTTDCACIHVTGTWIVYISLILKSFQKRMMTMNNTMYILRKKSMNYIERKLVEQSDLKLCFKNKKERIFKNDELLITCKDKYIAVLVYNESYKDKANSVVNLIS